MNLNAPELMQPVFDFLDGLIRDYGDILFMLLVYATIPLIAWILSGGLRRKFRGHPHITVVPFFMIRPPAPPPPDLPPIIGDDPERGRWDCNDDLHFPD
jgi:hypothetical protein